MKEKKRTASGIHHRKGKRGYVGKMHTPSDFLTGAEKRKYKKASKVVTYKMYQTIMSYEEFINLDLEQQKIVLQGLRRNHPNKDIMKAWNLSTYEYYTKTLKRLGIEGNRSGKRKPRTVSKAKPSQASQSSVVPVETVVERYVAEPVKDGMTVTVSGKYTAEQLQAKLEKLALLLDDSTEYQVSISLIEK